METIATQETEEIKEVAEEEVPAEILERIPTSPEEDEDAKAKLVQEIKDDIQCPHCGLGVTDPRVVVTEGDKDDWTRHIMSAGSRRFTKEYSLYGGRVQIVLRSRTGLEERDIDKAVEELVTEIKSIADLGKIRAESLKVQLVYSLDSITYTDLDNPENTKTTTYEPPSAEAIKAAWELHKVCALTRYTELIAELPAALVSIIAEKSVLFNGLTSTLTIQGLSPDF